MRLFKNHKGQAALEYLMVMAIAMFLLVPLFSLVSSFTHDARFDMEITALQDSLQSLSDSADMVYSQGHPARMTTKFYAPKGIMDANVKEHFFHVKIQTGSDSTDVFSKTHANLTGSLPQNPGTYQVTLNMTERGLVNVSY